MTIMKRTTFLQEIMMMIRLKRKWSKKPQIMLFNSNKKKDERDDTVPQEEENFNL